MCMYFVLYIMIQIKRVYFIKKHFIMQLILFVIKFTKLFCVCLNKHFELLLFVHRIFHAEILCVVVLGSALI